MAAVQHYLNVLPSYLFHRWSRGLPHTWGLGQMEETKVASGPAYFPAPVSLVALYSLHTCSVRPCSCPQVTPSSHLSRGPPTFQVLTFSCVIASLPAHRYFACQHPPALFLSSTDLPACHRSVILSRSLHWGTRSLTSSLFYPLSSRFLFFIFLSCHMHAIKCILRFGLCLVIGSWE